MDWFIALESKRRFALLPLILIMVATIAVTALRDPRTFDGFWHLKMGQDWVENGLSPWLDHYSFTYQGEEIDSPPVAFQVGLYWLVKELGLNGGFKLYKFLSMTLVLLMMLWWLHRIKARVLVYLLVLPLLVALLQFRATVRPELISYSFLILAVILFERARCKQSFSNLFPVALLMLVWNNYHSSIFGYVVFLGLFIDLGLKNLREHANPITWVKWLGWGALIVGLGFANPSVTHPLIAAITFPDEWKTLIQEYNSPLMYKNVPSLYVLIFVSALTLGLCWRQRLPGYFFVCLFLIANAASMARLVAPMGVVVLCVFGLVVNNLILKEQGHDVSKSVKFGVLAAIAFIFLVPLLHNVITARVFISQNASSGGYYPFGLVQYMKDEGLAGHIINDHDMGGFLIYGLAPASQVYIDGRTNILYPLSHYQHMQEVFASADALSEEVRKFDVEFVMVRNTVDKALLLEQTGDFKLDYADVRYFLYRRDVGNTPIAGTLWARPYCWSESVQQSLVEEAATAIIYYTPATQLNQFLQLMTSFGAAEDKGFFLQQPRDTIYWPDASKRFVGYQALRFENYQLALSYFRSVLVNEAKDLLAIALAELKLGRPHDAEMVLASALEKNWPQLELVDLKIMHGLLTEIRDQHELKLLNNDVIESFEAQLVDQLSSANSQQMVNADTFCLNTP